jgi:hypothetical protein
MMLRSKGLIVLVYGDVLKLMVIDGKEVGKILESLASLRRKKREKRVNYIHDAEDNSEQLFHGLTLMLGYLWGPLF